MQDRRRLGHFNHERRTAARQIIRRSHACPHAIEQRQTRLFRRHERTHLREDADNRRLPEHGALAAHVRTRDDQQAIG